MHIKMRFILTRVWRYRNVAQWPASAEEMERLVTPLEITLAGMPGLKATHSKSLFGLTHLRNVFQYGVPYEQARQEVINRLAMINQPLPPGVTPQISPASPIGEIYRYTLKTPKDQLGNEIYTLNDLKAMQLAVREFRRVPHHRCHHTAARSNATRSSPTRTG